MGDLFPDYFSINGEPILLLLLFDRHSFLSASLHGSSHDQSVFVGAHILPCVCRTNMSVFRDEPIDLLSASLAEWLR